MNKDGIMDKTQARKIKHTRNHIQTLLYKSMSNSCPAIQPQMG